MTTIATIDEIVIEEHIGNPYDDLGFPDADKMLVKAGLAQEMAQVIKRCRLTQQRAAELLGMPQPELSRLLRGKFRDISRITMTECLNRLRLDVGVAW